MISLYRCLLYLYPAAYRCEYGEEMAGVFRELQAEIRYEKGGKSIRPGAIFCLREFAGLLSGALREHSRAITGSDFSFPIQKVHHAFRIPLSKSHAHTEARHSRGSDPRDRETYRDRAVVSARVSSATPANPT